MSKTYTTSKQVASRIKKIDSLKRITPAKLQEKYSLKKLYEVLKAKEAEEKVMAYERAIRSKSNALGNRFPVCSDETKLNLMKFLYPESMMKPRSKKLESRFSKHEIIDLTYRFLSFSQNSGCDVVAEIAKVQKRIYEFYEKFQGGDIHSFQKEVNLPLTDDQLEDLVNVVSPNSNGVGRLEVLLRILLIDCIKVHGGADLNFKDRSKNVEIKLGVENNGGRPAGHKKLNPGLAELTIQKNIKKKYGMTFNHPVYLDGCMSKTVMELLKVDSIENILELYAEARIGGWNVPAISNNVKKKFVTDIVNNAKRFLVNGEFTEKSETMFNGAHDWFTYYTIEKFPNILFATEVKDNGYDVLFRVFNENDYNTPEKIINLCLSNKVGFCGKLKEGTGYDSVVHFYGIF